MPHLLACDVSYYQAAVNDAYPHPWLIFRGCDGTFRDPKFAANYRWSKKAVKSGKLAGFTVYGVYRPGVDVVSVLKGLIGKPGRHVTVMLDIESWSGAIAGNHSTEITRILDDLAEWLGDKRRVLAYGNQGDLASIFPDRPEWVQLIVAGYSSLQPVVHNMIGWQYSDGTDRYSVPDGYPRSSAPFGRCDHNVFPDLDAAGLAARLGVSTTPTKEADPLADLTKKQLDDIANAVLTAALPVDGNKDATLASVLRNIRGNTIDTKTIAQSVAGKVDAVAQILGTAKTGVAARVASAQAELDKVLAAVKAIPTTVPQVETLDVEAIANKVVAKVKALTWGVK